MDKFCLIHIPKTAGVSLWMFLRDNVYGENSAEHFNDYDNNTEDPNLFEITKKDLIAGHIDYSDIVPYLSKQHRIATILREPVSRCISWYKYSSLISNDGINEENDIDLEHLPKSKHHLNTMYVHNTMTWMLGDHLDPVRRTKSPGEALEIAKERILEMDDILFFSALTDGIAQLTIKYKWDVNLHKIPWINPTVFMQPKITDKAVLNLQECNTLDTELYQFAMEFTI